ncbi:hypothetical protein [Streptomyces sp. NPDC054794]
MSRFDTYHWHGVTLADSTLDAARAELEDPSGEEAALRGFVTLLRSGNLAATGIALDHYHYAITRERHGFGSVLKEYREEVRRCARKILRQGPAPGSATGAAMAGADWASALLIMINQAEQEDAEIIAGALDAPPNFDAESAAFRAAGRILQQSTGTNERLVAVLSRAVFDEARDADERLEALQALSRSPHAVTDLLRAAELDDLELQATAVRALARLDLAAHRRLVEEKAASWPEDAPYPASDVRDVLAELDDLEGDA